MKMMVYLCVVGLVVLIEGGRLQCYVIYARHQEPKTESLLQVRQLELIVKFVYGSYTVNESLSEHSVVLCCRRVSVIGCHPLLH